MQKTRKLISLLLAVMMVLSMCTVGMMSVSALPEDAVISDTEGNDASSIDGELYGLMGDADSNEKINVKDATQIQKFAAKLIELDETSKALADVDLNDKVNVKDATAIQKWVAKIPVDMPINCLVYIPTEETTAATEPTTQASEDEPASTAVDTKPSVPVIVVPTTVATEPSEAPTTEAKPTEPKPTEPKPTDPKPTEPKPTDAPAGDVTVYFQNNWMWSNVSVYGWNSVGAYVEWPGEAMTFVENDGNYDIYSYVVPADAVGIIFNGNKDTAPDVIDQTPDITEWYNGQCFYMVWDETANEGQGGNGVDSFEYVAPTEPNTVVTEPATTSSDDEEPVVTEPDDEPVGGPGYYLVGNLNGQDCWFVDETSADRKLKESKTNEGEYYLGWTFYGNDKVKVAYYDGTSITEWYKDGMDNEYLIGPDSNKVGDGTIYFNPEGRSDWSYTYFTVQPGSPVEEPEDPTPDDPTPDDPTPEEPELGGAGYYLVGTLNGQSLWGSAPFTTDRQFKESTTTEGEYYLNWTFYAGDELKVVYYDGASVQTWYKDNADNYKIGEGSDKVGYCKISFNPNGNSNWSYTYFTVQPDTPPVVTDPVVTDPVVTDPVVTDPAQSDPVVTDPAETDPVVTDPVDEPEGGAGYYLVGELNGQAFWYVDENSADRKLKESTTAGEYYLNWTFYGNDKVKVAYYDGTAITAWYKDGMDNEYLIGPESDKVGAGTIYFNPEGRSDWSYTYFTVKATADPVVTDPVVTDPVVTDPVVTDPVVTDPVVTDPVVTDPVVTDPVVTDPVVTDPVVTDPVVTDPVVTDPVVTDPKPEVEYITITLKPDSADRDWVLNNTGERVVKMVDLDTDVVYTFELGDGYWYNDEIPSTVVNVNFQRVKAGTVSHTWNAGNRGEEVNYIITGDASGYWEGAAPAGVTLYLKPNTNWVADGARFAAYCFGNGTAWFDMTDSDGDGIYEVTVPDGQYPNIIFCRMNPGAADNNWDNKWNQTEDLTIPTDGTNLYTVKDGTWDKGGGSWSTK